MPRPYLIGHIITLVTSFLFFYGGQAHLTDQYTPDLSAAIERQSHGAAKAWWWFALDAESVSTNLDYLDLEIGSDGVHPSCISSSYSLCAMYYHLFTC